MITTTCSTPRLDRRGRNTQSVVRAATLGLHVELYRETAARAGHDPMRLPVSINSHGFIADTAQRAVEVAFPAHAEVMSRIGRERGWPPVTRAQFKAERSPRGALFIGTPQEVIDKVLWEYELFRHDRFLLQLSVGTLPHDQVMRAIELLGTEVAPVVRRETAQRAEGSPTTDTVAPA